MTSYADIDRHIDRRDVEGETVAEAAALVRRLAESADPNLWAAAYVAAAGGGADPDAAFIAAMTPAVALATADFLDSVTAWNDEHSRGLTWTQPVPAHALAIATAFLNDPRIKSAARG